MGGEDDVDPLDMLGELLEATGGAQMGEDTGDLCALLSDAGAWGAAEAGRGAVQQTTTGAFYR